MLSHFRLRRGIVYPGTAMTDAPAKDLIRYDLLVQEAMKGVLKRVLNDAARVGLPGEHHFYVSFRTDFPGVRLSQRMRDKYPEEMTIVLQHQFWDLAVTEHAFEVGLSFSGVPERLLIPFDAITGFFDPSVQFGLKFELAGEVQPPALPAPPPAITSVPMPPATVAPLPKPRTASPRGAGSEPQETVAPPGPSDKARPDPSAADSPEASGEGEAAARVVSLDAFRKKPTP
jgi:hypothetical protein